jgi:hypothetical protein
LLGTSHIPICSQDLCVVYENIQEAIEQCCNVAIKQSTQNVESLGIDYDELLAGIVGANSFASISVHIDLHVMAILKELKPKLISVIESAELDILEFREQRYNRIFEIHDKILNLNFSTASPVEQELFIITIRNLREDGLHRGLRLNCIDYKGVPLDRCAS